jgi:hypothetical protein
MMHGTTNIKSTGPLAFTVGNDRTHESKEGDCDASQPAVEGDIRMEYSSDLLCKPNILAITKNYL